MNLAVLYQCDVPAITRNQTREFDYHIRVSGKIRMFNFIIHIYLLNVPALMNSQNYRQISKAGHT